MTDQDYKKQLDFLLAVRDEVSKANQIIIDIRKIKSDLNFLKEKVADKNQIIDLINKYKSELDIVERMRELAPIPQMDKILFDIQDYHTTIKEAGEK